MTAYTFDENLYSDLHKDVYGFRPRSWDKFYDSTDAEKQRIWDNLLESHEAEMKYYASVQKQNAEELKEKIQKLVRTGAGDVDTAAKWLLEADDIDEYDLYHGLSYVSYLYDISYDDAEFFFGEAIEMLKKEAA